jgi:catechol 2,3-dioxygenase-like lactoylglutathione lyase family enzyme
VAAIAPTALDHVALWVDDREPLAALLCDHLGMHVIERTDRFTLVGADAREGKLTLFAADGPRETGALAAVVLRVPSVEEAVARLPAELGVAREDGVAWLAAPEGLRLGLVERTGAAVDLEGVRLRVSDPEAMADALAELGFDRDDGRLRVGDRWVALEDGGAPEAERPLLNHVALLVDSVEAVAEEARRRGIEVADVGDAPNTLAVFLWAPDRVKLEYVEHKPSFSLR